MDLKIGDASFEHAQDADATDSYRLPLRPNAPGFQQIRSGCRPRPYSPGSRGNAVVSAAPASPANLSLIRSVTSAITSSENFNRTRDYMAMANSYKDEQPSVIKPCYAPAAGHDPVLVYEATVQLPTFDKVEPRAWFGIADANFGLCKVTDSHTKYYYVLSKLDSATLRKLSTFLDRPLGSDPYQEIQQKLCKTFEQPLQAKLDAFLATTDAGDERPAELGLELQRLLSNASLNDVLERVFLRSLKPTIITAITGSLSADFETIVAGASASPYDLTTVSAISGPPAHLIKAADVRDAAAVAVANADPALQANSKAFTSVISTKSSATLPGNVPGLFPLE